ncbi:MAG: hypothetical protein E4H01_11580 [Lysobacterales bacterium]|nr:MAG: hypothetical protein E4H01_11580 [Xanthomonadales bacterium]
MLGYVCWHVRRAGVTVPEYEAADRTFHDALWATPVQGLLGLRIHRLADIPWLAPGQGGYEDWHLLADSGALDVLNEAAVTRARQAVHDRIAGMAANGTAGLYGLRLGAPIEPAFAYWLSKPVGMKYADFDESLRPLIAGGCCLWGRRMTLGPTPEFCLHAPAEVKLPHAALALKIEILHRSSHR